MCDFERIMLNIWDTRKQYIEINIELNICLGLYILFTIIDKLLSVSLQSVASSEETTCRKPKLNIHSLKYAPLLNLSLCTICSNYYAWVLVARVVTRLSLKCEK